MRVAPVWRRLLAPINRLLRGPFGVHRAILFEADVSQPLPDVRPTLPVEVTIADDTDIAEIAANTPARIAVFERRLKQGETCILARIGGRVVSSVWLKYCDHWDDDLHATIRIPEFKCVGYEAFTVPDARGHGIRQLLHVEERKRCRAAGRDRLVFWLRKGITPTVLRKWNQLGLHQTAVAEVATYRLFWRLKFSRSHSIEVS